ncbi:MAG TPA: SpoIID/LytB domain-containing protein [Limnochordia bacterium]
MRWFDLKRFGVAAMLALLGAGAAGCGWLQAGLFRSEPRVTVVDPQSGRRRTLPIEEYVKGVVAGEMGRLPAANGEEEPWPDAAYQAQAILARTFAMERLSRTEDGTLSTDVEEAQAYRPEGIIPAIERAVEATRGRVLMHDGDYVRAWFHSYSGGITATAREGLGFDQPEPKYIQSVELGDNPYVPTKFKAWELRVPLAEVAAALREKAGVDVGRLAQIEVSEKGPSGRITELTLIGSSGRQTISGPAFRLALGADRMRSTLVDEIGVADGTLFMRGRGFGHGVGMSQWDAYRMAKEGWSAERILHRFFKDVEITRAWR